MEQTAAAPASAPFGVREEIQGRYESQRTAPAEFLAVGRTFWSLYSGRGTHRLGSTPGGVNPKSLSRNPLRGLGGRGIFPSQLGDDLEQLRGRSRLRILGGVLEVLELKDADLLVLLAHARSQQS